MYKDRGLYSLYHQRIHVLQFEGFIILNIGKCEVGEKSINQSSESLYTHMVATTYFACYIYSSVFSHFVCYIFQFRIFIFCLLHISVPYFHVPIPTCWVRWFLAGGSVKQSGYCAVRFWIYGLFLCLWSGLARTRPWVQ